MLILTGTFYENIHIGNDVIINILEERTNDKNEKELKIQVNNRTDGKDTFSYINLTSELHSVNNSIKILYAKKKGKSQFKLGIIAPKDMAIFRKKKNKKKVTTPMIEEKRHKREIILDFMLPQKKSDGFDMDKWISENIIDQGIESKKNRKRKR